MARRMRQNRMIIIILFLFCISAGIILVEHGGVLITGLTGRSSRMYSSRIYNTEPLIENNSLYLFEIPKETTITDIKIYFCPQDDCEGELFGLLDSAKRSIHCGTFELDLPRIISLLENKSRAGVEVGVVVDGDYFYEVENHSWARHDNRSALMHNKFCIVDERWVYMGSMNPTVNCAYKNNNNLVIIESKYLVENYEAEFSELWNGNFGKGGDVPYPVIEWNNITLKNYFCPEDGCQKRVREEIAKAKSSIYFMQFSFTDDYIGRDLVIKAIEGVDVRGVFEKTKLSNYSEYNLLEYQGIDIRKDTNKYNLHHKVFIIDNRTVITGSYNPSASANSQNDENILIIEDEGVARMFAEELWRLYETE